MEDAPAGVLDDETRARTKMVEMVVWWLSCCFFLFFSYHHDFLWWFWWARYGVPASPCSLETPCLRSDRKSRTSNMLRMRNYVCKKAIRFDNRQCHVIRIVSGARLAAERTLSRCVAPHLLLSAPTRQASYGK
jgi:hypothetical protein